MSTALGRQVLEYVPGPMAIDQPPLDAEGLHRAGRLIMELHDTSAGFEPPPGSRWNVVIPPDHSDLICHRDLAPWNLVTGADRWVFIDWDGAGPGSRLWDLAYAMKGSCRWRAGATRRPTDRGSAPWPTGTAGAARSGDGSCLAAALVMPTAALVMLTRTVMCHCCVVCPAEGKIGVDSGFRVIFVHYIPPNSPTSPNPPR